MQQREHLRRLAGNRFQQTPPKAASVRLQPQPSQVRIQEHELHRFFVIQVEDSRGLDCENAKGQGFTKSAEYHAVLLATLEHLKWVFVPARIDADGLYATPEHEGD